MTGTAQASSPAARTRSLKANFAINVAGALVPLVVSLVTVPIYIRHIGDARYGVLSIVWVLLGYFGFLDLGLSRAAANALARLKDAPQEARARVLVTTLALNLCMGLVGSLVLALAGGYLLQHLLNVPEALKPEIASAFPWIVALFPLALVSGVGIGALESREEFLRANILQVMGTSLGQIVPVMLAVGVGPSLAVVIPAAAAVRGMTVLAILVTVWRREKPLSKRHFDRSSIGQLLKYGGWVSVSALVTPFLNSVDQLAIGSVIGVAAVAHYSVPMSLAVRSQIFAVALARTLFPRLSGSTDEEAELLASKAFNAVSFGYASICGPVIILTPLFLKTWIGPEFATTAAPVAVILFLGAWVNGVANVPYCLLQSKGRPHITGYFHLIEILPYIGLLIGLSRYFGIEGAATAWTLRCVSDAILLCLAAKIRTSDIARAAAPSVLVVASAVGTMVFAPAASETIIAAALIGVFAIGTSMLVLGELRRSLTASLTSYIRSLATRFRRFGSSELKQTTLADRGRV